MKKIVFILYITYSIVVCQPSQFGFNWESYALFNSVETEYSPLSIYFNYNQHIIKNISIEVMPGFIYTGEENYNGLELMLNGKYYLSETNREYFLLGLVYHKNIENSGHSYATNSDSFVLGQIGMGTLLGKLVNVRITYQYPLSDGVYGKTFSGGSVDELKLDGLLKLGFGMSFTL